MRNELLIIEGKEADLIKGLGTLITKVIDDVSNFGSRENSFSKTVVLPGTPNNNRILGNIFEFTSNNNYIPSQPNVEYNFNASKGARCIYLVDGIMTLKGILKLVSIKYNKGKHEYECNMFGELTGFVNSLGNGRLEDLDFSEYNHTYNVTNIVASWANGSAGAGYVYPLIDYGGYSHNGKLDWKVGTFRPAFFLKEYCEKIVSGSGYTVEFPLKETTRFKSLIIPHNQKILTKKGVKELDLVGIPADPIIDVSVPIDNVLVVFTNLFVGNFTPNVGNTIYTYTGTPATLEVRIKAKGLYRSTDGILISCGGAYAPQIGLPPSGSVVPYEIDQVFNVALVSGNTLQMLFSSQSTAFDYYATVESASIEIKGNSTNLSPVNINDTVTVNDTLPKNILQKDLIAWVMKLFNLYLVEDNLRDKHLIITPFVDFMQAEYEDYSLKVDHSKSIEVSLMGQLTARYYEFKYKEDSDFYNDLYKKRYNTTYGSRIQDTASEFANSSNVTEIGFSPTPLVGYQGEVKVFSTIFKQNGTAEEAVDSNIRLLHTKLITAVPTWHIRNQLNTANIHSDTQYLYAGHFNDPDFPTNDLNFGAPKELFYIVASGNIGANQFNLYWSSYLAEITDKDAKILKCYIKLSLADFYALDFSKPKYIGGALWRVNKIMDFDTAKEAPVMVEFVRINYLNY